MAQRNMTRGILTLSRSSTVQRVLQVATAQHTPLTPYTLLHHQAAIDQGQCTRVVVCESRPLFEGVTMARALQGAATVEVITDAQAAVFVQGVDAVLLGADCVHGEGVDNKVGSHLLALAAASAGVPVYALADMGKVSGGAVASLVHPLSRVCAEKNLLGLEEKGAEEVTSAWPDAGDKHITPRNIYFETTPWRLLTGLITDEGLQQDVEALCVARRDRTVRTLLEA